MPVADLIGWRAITALGDSAVLLPCIALITLWLAIPVATRWLAWRWLWVALAVMGLVAVSKLAFMGWLVSLPTLDFTGLSGHSTMAALVWPSLGALLWRRHNARWQALGMLLGLALALAIAWSRLVLHDHSVSEVVLGVLLGAGTSLAFVYRYWARWKLPERVLVAALSMLLVLPLVYGDRFPSQGLLKLTARALSGHPAYRRQDLQRSRQAQDPADARELRMR